MLDAPACPNCARKMWATNKSWLARNPGTATHHCPDWHCWGRAWVDEESVTTTRDWHGALAEMKRRMLETKESAASRAGLTTDRAGEPATTPHERSA